MIRRRTSALPEIFVSPDSLPRDYEDYYFSITVCGDTRPVWGFHDARDEEGGITWGNPPLDEKHLYNSSRSMSDRVEDVGSYVTPEIRPGTRNPRDYIFGVNCPMSLESAAEEAVSRGGVITVYVVGTNRLQLQLISKLFAVIPSRIYLMRSSEFFNAYEMGNTNIEVDRLAALRGSAHCKGFPSLLFDAGEYLTYTAADSKARVLGGGTSAGLLLRVNSMSRKSGDLDHITSEALVKILEEVAKSKKPLPTFSDNTEESVVSAALCEVSCHIRHIVKVWLEKVGLPSRGKTKRASSDVSTFGKVNNRRVISIIGKNAYIIEKLLQSNNGGLIESFHPRSELQNNTSVSHHFIPDGIQSAISRQSMLTKINDEQSIISLYSTSSRGEDTLGTYDANDELPTVISNIRCKDKRSTEIGTTARRSEIDFISKRVSKKVQVSGNNDEVKHGVVDSVTKTYDIDLYFIKFDDGTSDEASLEIVTEMRQLYKKIEESESKSDEMSKRRNVSIGKHSSATENLSRKRGRPKKDLISNNLSDEREDVQPMSRKRGRPKKDPISNNVSDEREDVQPMKKRKKLDDDPNFYVGKKVANFFDLVLYYGEVESFYSKTIDVTWFKIAYEDGDGEEMNEKELKDALQLFQTHPK